MTAAELSQIFDPFFTTKVAGRGLGLCVVQRIVQRYGGNIQAKSSPGHGTQFVVLLPCTFESVSADRPSPAQKAQTASQLKDRQVLMVEDEEGLRLAVSQMLRNRGLRVVEAADGTQALELFRRSIGEIDVIVLDMTLPGISSRELVAEAGRMRPDIKVILTTAYSREIAAPAFSAPQIGIHPQALSDQRPHQLIERRPLRLKRYRGKDGCAGRRPVANDVGAGRD